MSTHRLKPWTEIVRLHPDVESGNTAVAAYAIDLGALAAGDPNIPAAYRDAQSFFGITYPTSGLRRMLEEVLGRLCGQEGDRVLQLRSPFGGGKSHTLAALYYAAKDRSALAQIPECQNLPDPGEVRVAVFDGEKFDALAGKEVGGQQIRTIWGWLAWQLGENAFALVREHDANKTAPGGDVVAQMLGERPTLLLLDEVLQYLERASADRVLDSTHERQAKDFMHVLSVEAARAPKAVMVYSLQASPHEALGNSALLEELDHITSRVDAKREPVTGDEVLAVLKRRLLSQPPDEATAVGVAQELSQVVTHMRESYAQTEEARHVAQDEGVALRDRMVAAYPFHPALIDIMKDRWASVKDFQRTRGAIRFLAVCMHSLKERGNAQVVLGPGDVPLEDGDVLHAFFTEVGQREPYRSVVDSDIIGARARIKPIDDRLARENPALRNVRPALRLATAILMYSFGGLTRPGSDGEQLPAGAVEDDILAACVGPDLDSTTARACLKDMSDVRGCLYLHYDGARYCFKTTPNVNFMIEQEADAVDRDRGRIDVEIKERLGAQLTQHSAFLWPERTDEIPDEDASFLVGYLPTSFALKRPGDQERIAKEFFEKYGDRPRRYRNGLGLAVPSRAEIEPLRRSMRYVLAIKRAMAKQSQLTREQLDQVRERQRTEEAGVESALRKLYSTVWLPRVRDGAIGIDRVEVGGRGLQATAIHARVMELLTSVSPQHVFGKLMPSKILERMMLGQAVEGGERRFGLRVQDVQDAFFGILGFPRLTDHTVLAKAIAAGVEQGLFGYVAQPSPALGEDGRYQVAPERVAFQRPVLADEIDSDSGFIMLPEALPLPPETVPAPLLDPLPDRTDEMALTIAGSAVPGALVSVSGGRERASQQLEEGETRFAVRVQLHAGALNTLHVTARDANARLSQPAVMVIRQGEDDSGGGARVTRSVQLSFWATRDQLYNAWNGVANLADAAGTVHVTVEGRKDDGFDPVWLRNAVTEPIEESGAEVDR
jgi:hypothetical protein